LGNRYQPLYDGLEHMTPLPSAKELELPWGSRNRNWPWPRHLEWWVWEPWRDHSYTRYEKFHVGGWNSISTTLLENQVFQTLGAPKTP